MAKYDSVLGELKNQLSGIQKIVVALPASLTLDALASGLSLYLSLKQAGKEVSVVSSDTIKVSQSHLYGVDKISPEMPKASGGNLTLTLEGVVAADGSVPSLEKLDWFPEGENLNLVFHVLPGQKFEPKRIVPKMGNAGGVDLIITVGVSSLEALGNLYTSNTQAFSGAKLLNIDNSPSNSKFGTLALVDQEAATLSEMVIQIIQGLALPLDADSATNIIAGIYDRTQNLSTNAKPETFMSIGLAMQAGGKVASQPSTPSQPTPQPAQPTTPAQEYAQNFPPLNQVFGFPVQPQQSEQPQTDNFTVPPVVNAQPQDQTHTTPQYQPSSEERPMGEYAGSSNPEVSNPDPDWLTPKVYKGTNIG